MDGKKLYVTHEYPGKISEINTTDFKVTQVFNAGKMTRGIALSPDEKNLFVTEFYTASVNKLDAATGKMMDQWKGRDDDNFARQITAHPTRPKVYYPHIRSRTHIIDADGSIFPEFTICDTSGLPDKTRRMTVAMDTFNGVYVVATPWETAVSPDGKTLYVIYSGTNDMNICKVMDDDYSEIQRVGTAVRLGINPRAIRVNPNGKEVYVYNALEFTLTIHELHFLQCLRADGLHASLAIPMAILMAGFGRTPKGYEKLHPWRDWPTHTRCTGPQIAMKFKISNTRSEVS